MSSILNSLAFKFNVAQKSQSLRGLKVTHSLEHIFFKHLSLFVVNIDNDLFKLVRFIEIFKCYVFEINIVCCTKLFFMPFESSLKLKAR